MAIDNKVMEKLRKILALAGDKAATQGEIEAAMARAKEIAMQHNIELADVNMEDPNDRKKGLDIVNDTGLTVKAAFERKWHGWIFHVLKEMFGVRVVLNRLRHGSRHRITKVWMIGEATDVAIAQAVFKWLEELYPKSYRELVNDYSIPVDDAASQHGYYRGLTAGILAANLRKQEEVKQASSAESNNKYAVVLRNKEDAIEQMMALAFPDLKQRKARAVQERNSAAALGYQKGRAINLRQMGAGKQNGQIK